jgi:hypothetical protein
MIPGLLPTEAHDGNIDVYLNLGCVGWSCVGLCWPTATAVLSELFAADRFSAACYWPMFSV